MVGVTLLMLFPRPSFFTSLARRVEDSRKLCINGCGRVQITANYPPCPHCVTEKNKRKREEGEESEVKKVPIHCKGQSMLSKAI